MVFHPTRSTLFLLAVLVPALAHAGDLKPRAEVNFRAGTDRSILMTEFWAPLAQQNDRVLYGDLRLMGDDSDNRESNLGFGYRQISARTNSVLGSNIWIDRRRTESGNYYNQLTLGLESLGDTIDLRANGYIQLNDSKSIVTSNTGSTTPYLANSGIYYDTNGLIVEEPQDGVDAEIGYRLPLLQNHIDATRVYVGGYHFWGDQTDNVTGFRLRTEAQINSIFSVGARFQHDGPRGSQGFLEATLRFPFKSKKLYQEHGLQSRLDESPERDIDIVTGTKVVDTGRMKPVLNASSTQQRILYVDNTNTNAGDGSKENPFNTLAAAQAALQNDDILYINRGNGTTAGMDQGITIDKAGVTLIGSGSTLTYEGITLLEAGLAPLITNNQASIDGATGNGIYVTNDNSFISGITVSNAQGHGIAVNVTGEAKWNTVSVNNVTSINNVKRGLHLFVTGNSSLDNVVIKDSQFNGSQTSIGLSVQSNNGQIGNLVINNNSIRDNFLQGVYVLSNTNGRISSLTAAENTVSNNIGHGLHTQANNGGTIDNIIYQNNTAFNNGNAGLSIVNSANSQIGTFIVKSNLSNNNSVAGVRVEINTGSLITSIIENNLLSGNTEGILLYAQNNGRIGPSFVHNNYIGNSQQNGIRLYTIGATSAISTSLSGNTITNNGLASSSTQYYGIRIDNDSTSGTFVVDLGGGSLNSAGLNRIYNNFYQDVFIDSRPSTSGTTSGVTISARYNWWGINSGLNQGTRVTLDNGTAPTGSSIDATSHRTTDPAP